MAATHDCGQPQERTDSTNEFAVWPRTRTDISTIEIARYPHLRQSRSVQGEDAGLFLQLDRGEAPLHLKCVPAQISISIAPVMKF